MGKVVVTASELRASYSLFALAMHPEWCYTKFQAEILAPVLDGIAARDPKFKRTIVNAPFRHSKTEYCIETFIPFYMGRNPRHTVILLSYGHKLARKFGREIRDRMRSDIYAKVFPHSVVTSGSRASDEFSTVSGGHFYASGFDGTVNGLGADALFIDDPVKNKAEALSETVQAFHRDLYNNVVRTRLEPDASILIVTTRWTPDDLVGWRIGEDGGHDYLMDRPYEDMKRATA